MLLPYEDKQIPLFSVS